MATSARPLLRLHDGEVGVVDDAAQHAGPALRAHRRRLGQRREARAGIGQSKFDFAAGPAAGQALCRQPAKGMSSERQQIVRVAAHVEPGAEGLQHLAAGEQAMLTERIQDGGGAAHGRHEDNDRGAIT